VLVIGAGPTTVDAHLPVLRQLRDRGEIVLALVCDIESARASSARQAFGFKESSGDARTAVARDDIDAVYVFGSAQLHYEYGLAALTAGKHLFVEKPVAPSYLQALDMAQTAQERALIAVGGLNRRFFKSLTAVRERAGGSRWRFAEVIRRTHVAHGERHSRARRAGVHDGRLAAGIDVICRRTVRPHAERLFRTHALARRRSGRIPLQQ
jgi:predicted dehydrogenase